MINVATAKYGNPSYSNFGELLWIIYALITDQHSAKVKSNIYLPATTVSARDNRCRTCSMRLTSVHACKFLTLFLKIAIKTLHISAWNKNIIGAYVTGTCSKFVKVAVSWSNFGSVGITLALKPENVNLTERESTNIFLVLSLDRSTDKWIEQYTHFTLNYRYYVTITRTKYAPITTWKINICRF